MNKNILFIAARLCFFGAKRLFLKRFESFSDLFVHTFVQFCLNMKTPAFEKAVL